MSNTETKNQSRGFSIAILITLSCINIFFAIYLIIIGMGAITDYQTKLDTDGAGIHFFDPIYFDKSDLPTELTASMAFCETYGKVLMCGYEFADRYYFQLTSEKFSYRYFGIPSAENIDGKLVITLNNSTIHRSVSDEESRTFYVNKSDFPNIEEVVLDYFVFDIEYNISEHKQIPITISKL